MRSATKDMSVGDTVLMTTADNKPQKAILYNVRDQDVDIINVDGNVETVESKCVGAGSFNFTIAVTQQVIKRIISSCDDKNDARFNDSSYMRSRIKGLLNKFIFSFDDIEIDDEVAAKVDAYFDDACNKIVEAHQ